MSIQQATLKANAIIRDLQIRYPSEIDINDICMERGAFVHEKHIDGAEAWLVRHGKRAIIAINDKLHELGRKRFATAHELGHFELHNDSQLLVCNDEDMLAWNQSKLQEVEANEFASCILMPETIFPRYVKKGAPNMDSVSELASEFGTTLTATALRYTQLSTEPCALAVSKGGILKWYRRSISFEFHLKVGEKLSPDTYAFDYFDGSDLPTRSRKVPADAWIAGNICQDGEISEHSVALGSYGIVLSLLWIDKEIRRVWQRDEEEQEFDMTNKFNPDGKRWQW